MLEGKKIGVGLTGSFCSLESSLEAIKRLKETGAELYFILSEPVEKDDSRFMKAQDVKDALTPLTDHPIITSIHEAEPFGPKIPLDLMVVLPCSANTMGKLANGLCDDAVTMAVKSTLRNLHPIVLGIFTNDALGNSGMNLMKLMNTKHFYFVPFGQDDPIKKPNSMVCDPKQLIPTCIDALKHQQYQPVVISYD